MAKGHNIPVTPERLAWLRDLAPRRTSAQLARAWTACWGEPMREDTMRHLCRRHGISTGGLRRFAAGNEPWNKGSKGLSLGGVGTRFGHGVRPHNEAPVGARVRDSSGYWKTKVLAEPPAPGLSRRQWCHDHVLTYIAAHGPVPPGAVVLVIDGDPEHCADPQNVAAVSRRELAWLNRHGWGQLPRDRALRIGMLAIAELAVTVQETAEAIGMSAGERYALTRGRADD